MQKLPKVISIDKAFTCLSEIANLLLEGGVIAVPTDTIYGLACCGLSTEALRRIYAIKGRDAVKPMAICLDRAASISRWCNADGVDQSLIDALLPGPVTVILPRRSTPFDPLSPLLNPGVGEIAMRVPACSIVLRISEALAVAVKTTSKTTEQCNLYWGMGDERKSLVDVSGFPLVLTSANPSGHTSTISPEEFESLWPQLDLVIDGGRIGSDLISIGVAEDNDSAVSRAGSTIVDLSRCVQSPGSNQYSIVRDGSALLQTEEILRNFGMTNIVH